MLQYCTLYSLFKSLIKDKEIVIIKNNLKNEVYESKRKGYYELYGSFCFSNHKKDKLTISCDRNEKNLEKVLIKLDIINEKKKILCKLVENKLIIKIVEGEKIEYKVLGFKYQSERTAVEIKKIINKKSNLPHYETSIKDHLDVFDLFDAKINFNKTNLKNKLPIT